MKNVAKMIILLLSIDGHAGLPVIDPANLAENAASVATQIKQLQQATRRIQYEIDSAKRFAGKLGKYKLDSIQGLINQVRSFRTKTRSIGYAYKSVVQQFDKTYGSHGNYANNFTEWEKQSDDSAKDAMEAQALLEKSETHMSDLDAVVQAKDKSEGEAETLQALSEIHTIQSKQLNDLTHIIASDARARQSVIMEQRSKERQQRKLEEHLMSDFNQHGSSKPLAYFPSLGSTVPKTTR